MDMKSLKYRYFDSVTKQFVYSDNFGFDNEFERLEYFFSKAKKYAEGEVEQWIGTIDEMGREIYEGDVVIGEEWINCRSPAWGKLKPTPILWNGRYACFVIGHDSLLGDSFRKVSDLKIVGNIHQNADILK